MYSKQIIFNHKAGTYYITCPQIIYNSPQSNVYRLKYCSVWIEQIWVVSTSICSYATVTCLHIGTYSVEWTSVGSQLRLTKYNPLPVCPCQEINTARFCKRERIVVAFNRNVRVLERMLLNQMLTRFLYFNSGISVVLAENGLKDIGSSTSSMGFIEVNITVLSTTKLNNNNFNNIFLRFSLYTYYDL